MAALGLLALAFCICGSLSRPAAASVSDDAMSLLSFKSSVSLRRLSNWTAATSHCSWYGVSCGASSDRVVALNLTTDSCTSAGELAGTLSASIGNLTELRILSLACCGLAGEIPESVGNLKLLEVLELQENNFSTTIPTQISQLYSLRLLNLSYNSFSGPLLDKLIGYGRLSAIDLSNNLLSGGIIIDRASNCKFLRHLKLSNNFLINTVPPGIGKCVNLRTLLLDGNILEGRIPPEIGRIQELRVLDVSRNSLTDRIPNELSNCRKLSILVLTNLMESHSDNSMNSLRGEFNAFVGGVPFEVFHLPNLQIFWAPRSNLGGRLPRNWTDSCSLRVLNLGQNYLSGSIPRSISSCKKIVFLDLGSNNLVGYLPSELQAPCMVFFNVSRNNLTGVLPSFAEGNCDSSFIDDSDVLAAEDVKIWGTEHGFNVRANHLGFSVAHDFSYNNFVSSLPIFKLGDVFSPCSYGLLLNDNKLTGSFHVPNCSTLIEFSVNVSRNQLQGPLFLDCATMTEFEAANNLINGPIPPEIGNLSMLRLLDLQGNRLSGYVPDQLGQLQNLKRMFLRSNNLSGEIPSRLGELASLLYLDLSRNSLTGPIPETLARLSSLETLWLDHNMISGEIPMPLSDLLNLTNLDVSFNNLSGQIPQLRHQINCDSFKGNIFLNPCLNSSSTPTTNLPIPLDVRKSRSRSRSVHLVVAATTSASVLLCSLFVLAIVVFYRRRKGRGSRSKVLVTFSDAPPDLTYESVVRATGNFSLENLIGSGGFGSTYKAELSPGLLVAVKKLSVGRFHGIKQFDAEIRTLGRIRHKNLVTLIGYYTGPAEMFLIYNYLPGGNLETFIHERSGKNIEWSMVHKIALDVAQALAYLHYFCSPRIVHRDIKPSNILLDKELNAYLSDFGLARILEVSETHATTDVAGTFGYVAPEYATTCRVSDKADVYSFGVVLLELVSGKKSLDPSFSNCGNGYNIVAWAKFLIREGRRSELFSPYLWNGGAPRESLIAMLKLASVCTSESLPIRPSMEQVVQRLKQLKP